MIEACDALDIIRMNSEHKVPHFEVSAGTAALVWKAT